MIDPALLRKHFDAGDILCFPTETVCALAVNPWHPLGVARLFSLKQRSAEKPLSLLACDLATITPHLEITPVMQRLWDHFGPSPLTYVGQKKATSTLPDFIHPGTSLLGVRFPDHPLAQHILTEIGGMIAATSVNISGEPSAIHLEDIPPHLLGHIAVVIPGEGGTYGQASTVIDITTMPPTLLRSGSLSIQEIGEVLREPR